MALALMWVIQLVSMSHPGWSLYKFGIQPREPLGLAGIFFSPFLHDADNFEHILSNSLPFLVLSGLTIYSYRKVALKVFLWIWLVAGVWVWVFASSKYHIGSSGVVYGLAGFLITSGVVHRDKQAVAISLLVILLYGSLIWGVFPMKAGVSYESHFLGLLSGVLIALYYKGERFFEKKVYDWEREQNADENGVSFSYQDPNRPFVYTYKEEEKKGAESKTQ